MSVDSFVFIRDERLPTVAEWQKALDRAAVEIQLEDVGGLRTHEGYLPAVHRGNSSGFEWCYGTIADNFGAEPPAGLGDRQHVIDFITHSDMRELVCAMVAGAVLAQLTDGLVFDEESGNLIKGDAAMEIAKRVEAQL